MDLPQKDATQFTEEELIQIFNTDPRRAMDFRNVYLGMIKDIEYELGRISSILSDFTQRTSVIMTISGLLAFLPSLLGIADGYLHHFLIWTFPFLLLSIISFYFSSTRIGTLSAQMPTATPGSSLELLILKARVTALQDIWKMNYSLYNKVLEWYRATSALIYIYISSFAVNFYLFAFVGRPETCISILILFSVSLIGIAIYYRGKFQSKKGVQYGPAVYMHGTGGASTDDTVTTGPSDVKKQ